MMGGGGGFVGMIDNQANTTANDGYATVGTDTGHQGEMFDARWALDNLERQVNYGYVAVHRTAETAKAILRHYYRATEKHSYFSGCSNGGRQGLMEAQRFPTTSTASSSGRLHTTSLGWPHSSSGTCRRCSPIRPTCRRRCSRPRH
jgi:hypothetical protein